MRSGLAIVTKKNSGCDEVVGNAANLVEPRSPGALRSALLTLTKNAELLQSLGTAAQTRILRHFSWTSIADRYLEAYADCVTAFGGVGLDRRALRIAQLPPEFNER
jgi:glycosyltransferase involved in cell wall biosynthesis